MIKSSWKNPVVVKMFCFSNHGKTKKMPKHGFIELEGVIEICMKLE